MSGKNENQFYKKLLFTAVTFIIICIAITNLANNSIEKTSQEYISYEISQLINDLDKNAMNAKNKYRGQTVEITGKLKNIDSNGDYIALSPTNDKSTFKMIQCYIKNNRQKKKIKELSTGDTVSVKGKIKSVNEVLGYSLDIHSIN